jgi:glycosyltransferase involved in cell wall biosynthesis
MSNSKFIITSPKSHQGGVASFVSNIKPFLGVVEVFYRGRSSISQNILGRFFSSCLIPVRFACLLLRSKAKKTLINSSLSVGSMLRDGVLIRIAKLFNHNVLLFIHGFKQEDLSYRKLLKWGYFRADTIVVLASEFKQLLTDAGFSKQIEVLFNPIDAKLIENFADNPIRKDKRDILFLSRIEKDKGVFEALDWFKLLKNRYPDLIFHIAGDGSAKYDAERYANDQNIKDVIFYGFISGDKKITMLSKCSFFILMSSYKEGLPISILEAMSAGQIILTRPVGGIKDLYEQCKFGVMLDSLSPDVFAEAFEQYYNNPDLFNFTSNNNQQFAKTHFHPSIVAEKIKKIFDSI